MINTITTVAYVMGVIYGSVVLKVLKVKKNTCPYKQKKRDNEKNINC